jgi:predicted metalloprotease with PDZ domain
VARRSGARSLYLHADRPLISQNGTSTPLHEMVHVASGLHATGGADWIVEGLAEYYSVELLRRSNTISQKRFDQSIETLAQWSAGTKCVATDQSEGTRTAQAVLVMHALDHEIRIASHERKSLDDVARTLSDARVPVTNAALRAAAVDVIGGPAIALAGCP